MNKIKFVYFDIGGVLVDYVVSLEKIADELDIDFVEMKRFFKRHADDIDRETISWSEYEEVVKKYFKPEKSLGMGLSEYFVGNFKVVEQAHDLLRELEGRIDVGILSNVAGEVFELIKQKGKIPDVEYSVIVKSGELGAIKPEKEIYKYAQEKAGVGAEEILLIDDKAENIEAARSLGWSGVKFEIDNIDKSMEEVYKYLRN